MRIRELTVAVAELDEALAYYGSIRPRLAADLLREVQSVGWISEAHPPESLDGPRYLGRAVIIVPASRSRRLRSQGFQP